VTNSANAGGLSAAAQQGNFSYRNSGRRAATLTSFQTAGNAGYRSTGAAGDFEPTAENQRSAQSRFADTDVRSKSEYPQFFWFGEDEHIFSGFAR